MSDTSFRRATVWDAIEIYEMWKSVISKQPMRDLEGLEGERLYIYILSLIKKPDAFVEVCMDGDRCAGFIAGYLTHFDYGYGHPVGHIDMMCIEDDYKGKGYWDTGVENFTKWAKDSGVKLVKFDTPHIGKSKIMERKGWTPMTLTFNKEV